MGIIHNGKISFSFFTERQRLTLNWNYKKARCTSYYCEDNVHCRIDVNY